MASIQNIRSIQGRLRHNAESMAHRDPLTGGHKGALLGHFTESDAMRRLILYVWFRQQADEVESLSSKDLTNGEWQALCDLIDAHQMEKEWYSSARFHQAINQTVAYVNFRLV